MARGATFRAPSRHIFLAIEGSRDGVPARRHSRITKNVVIDFWPARVWAGGRALPKPDEPEPKRQRRPLGRAGKSWMFRRFTSARLFPHQRVQRVRTQWVQAITAGRASHQDVSIATDFCAGSVKSQAVRD